MVIELADFSTNDPDDFAVAMRELATVIAASPGYMGHTIQQSIENPTRFVLLARWESVEAHNEFRRLPLFDTWRERLGEHRSGAVVEHFDTVLVNEWDIQA